METAASPGEFLYPPPNTTLWYNYVDTIDVSWETLLPNATECYLTLWYYLSGDPWEPSFNQTVPVNGSIRVDLNVTGGAYYGQFNLNYTAEGGAAGLFLSSFFNVQDDVGVAPVSWPKTTASTSTATATTATTATSTSTTSSSSTSASETSTHQSSHSGLSSGAVAGICVGVIVPALGLLAFAFFFFFRRRGYKSVAATAGPPYTESKGAGTDPVWTGSGVSEAEAFSQPRPMLQELPGSATISELNGGSLAENVTRNQ